MKKPSLAKLKTISFNADATFGCLFDVFKEEYSAVDQAVAYIFIDLINAKLNALKALEYHYRDSGQNGRVKSKYPSEMRDVLKFIKKYAEHSEPGNPHSPLVLKEKFDSFGVLKYRNRLKKRPSK